MVAYFGNKTLFMPYNALIMREVYVVLWENDLMGVYSCWTKANDYIQKIEEKLDTTLFKVKVIPYMIDTDYHLDDITKED